MEYKFIKEHRENIKDEGEWISLLVSADGVQLWIDCHKDDDDYWSWSFNQYIFFDDNEQDQLVKATQEKILENQDNLEDFDMFIDSKLEELERS